MDHINSIILEGDLETDPVFIASQNPEDSCCHFRIQSIRNNRKNNPAQGEVYSFTIYAQNYLAESCSRRLRKGRGVRVVGRLVEKHYAAGFDDLPPVYVRAEYVEFKPISKTA